MCYDDVLLKWLGLSWCITYMYMFATLCNTNLLVQKEVNKERLMYKDTFIKKINNR